VQRITELLGGNLAGGGYIQFFTFVTFFWGVIEIRHASFWSDFERKYLSVELLPGEEHAILGANEVNKIRIQVADYLRKKRQEDSNGSYYLLEIIKKACTKFRSNNSSEAAFMIVESQSRINREKTESRQSGIRYMLWAIPSIGFIGTILGISQSLSIAATAPIEEITSALGVAFDTTLLALLLSLILMYAFHDLQEKTETLHQDIEEFVVENLINKIDVT
jgi:chemotaxis protein MotA